MQEHGEFELWVVSNVICARLSGSTNIELITRFGDQLKEIRNEQMPEQWGHIVWLDDWGLSTPETEPVIQALTAWCINNGLMRAAQVFSPSTIKRLQLDRMVTAEEGDFKRKQFEASEDAIVWLKQEGYPSDVSTITPPKL